MDSAKISGKKQPFRKRAAGLFLFLLAVSGFLLTGCLAKRSDSGLLNKEIKVFDVALFSKNADKGIRGVVPKKEPCLKGFDYLYDPLEITVGYGFDDRVRKITTRNRDTGMFGIRVGDEYAQGKSMILQAGFAQGDTPYRFVKDGFLFALLVDDRERIFGMTVELLD
ncbi:MAG: hypothetical protein M0009_02855 [Deltaproteobacteria bacterium]|nr:hypothetical protein [Deltaproteobacteria bacterium]